MISGQNRKLIKEGVHTQENGFTSSELFEGYYLPPFFFYCICNTRF